MVRKRYKKPYRARRKKPFYAKPLFWRSVFFFSLAAGTFWLVCFSSTLEIKEIEIAGTEKINGKDCIEAIKSQANKKIALFDSKSILLFDIDQAKKDLLAQFPQAENIIIEREFPSKIIASIQERREVAVFNDNGEKYLIDSDGVAFENWQQEKGFLEIVGARGKTAVGDRVIEKDLLSAILRMKSDIAASAGIDIVSAAIVTPERINLLTVDDWYIYFNPLKDISDQTLKLVSVMEDEIFKEKKENLEYIDIRFTRVYLKEKQAVESVSSDIANDELKQEKTPLE